jgi:raffinose/stachyose/melibiose transport system permease protein
MGNTATMAAKPMRRRYIDWSKISFKYLMLLPTFVLLIIFMFWGIIETFRLSLTSTIGLGEERYVGLANYVQIFTDSDFLAALLHVVQWSFFSVIIQIPFSFFIAFVCTNYEGRYVRLLRSIYYIGNILPATIIAMLAVFIFMPDSGLVVSISKLLGWKALGNIDFLGDPSIAFWSLFGLATWAYTGFQIAYFMANISQIPTEHYEAARIDGANKWQYARHIVIPQVWPAIRIQILLIILGCIKLFDLPWLVTHGGPVVNGINTTNTLVIYLYKQGWNNAQYGVGAAVGVVIFVLCLVVTIIQFVTQRRETT